MPTGWVGSTRRDRLPSNWGAITLKVLTRDHHQCQHIREDTGLPCLAPANQADHIIAGTDDDRLEALQALCKWHHDRKSGREGGLASGRSRRAKRDAAKPLHPGLVDTPHHQPQVSDDPPPF
jgi:5-methylcytosine-specific restriction protein A